MSQSIRQIDELLTTIELGGEAARPAAEKLMPLVYDELRRLAGSYLRRERAGHTLQATSLVNEAYLRLADQKRASWRSRTHFFAVGAQVMRRLLVDHARRRDRVKRGGEQQRVTLDHSLDPLGGPSLEPDQLISLHQALEHLAELDERQARIVELRFFGGLEVAEVAEVLGVSKRTVEGHWTHARAWLRRELSRAAPAS